MKTLLAFTLACCFVYLTVATVGDECNSSKDCSAGECCVHIHSYTKSRCKKLRQQGEFCFPDPSSHLVEGDDGTQKYKYMCPCVDSLECKAEEVTELEEGIIEYKDAKCTTMPPSSK